MRTAGPAARRARTARGFTLMELLVAMTVLALLAAIAIPSYTQYVRRAARAEARTALERSRQEMERWYTRQNGYTTFTRATEQAKGAGQFQFSWWSGDSPSANAYELSAVAVNCPDGSAGCVRIVATPGGARNWTDAECGSLWIENTGARGHTVGGTDVADAAPCWR